MVSSCRSASGSGGVGCGGFCVNEGVESMFGAQLLLNLSVSRPATIQSRIHVLFRRVPEMLSSRPAL